MINFVYPYHQSSVSSKLIAEELGIKRLKREGSKIKDSPDLSIINWGASRVPYNKARIINKPQEVADAANKLRFFRKMAEHKPVRTPKFTTDYREAAKWIADGHTVCSRAVLNGNSGKGLLVTNELARLPKNSPLYTFYMPKAAEFRVHIIGGHVYRVQKKVWPKDKPKPDNINWHVRNHENGFIFQVAGPLEIPNDVLVQAKAAMLAAGLDFGGVDVIYSVKTDKASILEINCAPGIEGHTVQVYANAMKDLLNA